MKITSAIGSAFTPLVPHRRVSRGRSSVRRGFTLIEILIVIAIAGLISAITIGGIGSIGASNRRTSCQTNLTQIYQACRLYRDDEGTFPPYAPPSSDNVIFADMDEYADSSFNGLLALYTNRATSADTAVLSIYLKRAKSFHCPDDTDASHASFIVGNSFNRDYISYQQRDDVGVTSDPLGYLYPCETYRPIRIANPAATNGGRELIRWDGNNLAERPVDDNTVITWCFHHRKTVGGRNYDNVLFYDGSVQLISRVQEDPASLSATPFTAWQRVPRKLN